MGFFSKFKFKLIRGYYAEGFDESCMSRPFKGFSRKFLREKNYHRINSASFISKHLYNSAFAQSEPKCAASGRQHNT